MKISTNLVSSFLLGLSLLVVTPLGLLGCESDLRLDPTCRCEGAVPEGRLNILCGQLQCLSGTGYECVGPNMAVGNGAACLPGTDGGTGEDAWSGTDGSVPDSSVSDSGAPDSGRSDAGTDSTCATTTYYRDADGDGFGNASERMDACTEPSGFADNDRDCLDSDRLVNPDAVELCDALDNDCDGNTAACSGMAGAHTGAYRIYTDERVGSSVINSMECTGTSSITIDLVAASVVTGTVTCNYSRSLSGFDSRQTGTITGTLAPDGTITGRLVHDFGDFSDRMLTFTGSLTGGGIAFEGTGSWRPHPMSAVPWRIEFSVE